MLDWLILGGIVVCALCSCSESDCKCDHDESGEVSGKDVRGSLGQSPYSGGDQ